MERRVEENAGQVAGRRDGWNVSSMSLPQPPTLVENVSQSFAAALDVVEAREGPEIDARVVIYRGLVAEAPVDRVRVVEGDQGVPRIAQVRRQASQGH